MPSSLRVIGLTGGIASGKSVVAAVLRGEGLPVLDADALGQLVLQPGEPAWEDVIATFGTDILSTDGKTIDRQKLGRKVFDDTEERKKLESITHPAIAQMARRGMDLIASRGEPVAVYEAALLVETELYRNLDGLVLVASSLDNQLTRLCHRDSLSIRDAATRIACQMPLSDKRKVADYVIENDGTFDDLTEQAVRLAAILKEHGGLGPQQTSTSNTPLTS